MKKRTAPIKYEDIAEFELTRNCSKPTDKNLSMKKGVYSSDSYTMEYSLAISSQVSMFKGLYLYRIKVLKDIVLSTDNLNEKLNKYYHIAFDRNCKNKLSCSDKKLKDCLIFSMTKGSTTLLRANVPKDRLIFDTQKTLSGGNVKAMRFGLIIRDSDVAKPVECKLKKILDDFIIKISKEINFKEFLKNIPILRTN